MPLASLSQLDLSAGMWRSVARHLIPANGAYELLNVLLDQDGSGYRRGGAAYLSTNGLGAAGLQFVWEGFLTPGARTLVANAADFGVLDGAEAMVNLGGAGLAGPTRAVEVGGVLFIGGGAMYGGSRKTAAYSAGTVTLTKNSKTVTGASTSFTANVDAGMLFRRGSERVYVVQSVDSNTQLTLRDAYEGVSGAGVAYSASPVLTASSPYRSAALYAVAAGRLFTLEGRRGYFAEPDRPDTFNAAESYHELPEGCELLGGAGLADRLLACATNGIWQISNLHYDLTDDFGNTQHRVEHVHPELVLWSHAGIATWQGRLVVPCVDHVYLVDGVSSPVPISRPVSSLYRSYVAAGHHTGKADVYGAHLFLPVLDAAGAVVDLLTCRLDQKGTPWTHQAGHGANVSALAVRSGGASAARDPKLLAASLDGGSRVLDLTPIFGPDLANKNDPDGSTPELDVITRDYQTGVGGRLNENTVTDVRVRYEMRDAAADDPTMQGFYSTGESVIPVSLWDVFRWDEDVWEEADAGEWVQMEGSAGEDEGRSPFMWVVAVFTRYIRFRFRSNDPVSRLAIRALEVFVAPANRR